jgi:hypothetical protein
VPFFSLGRTCGEEQGAGTAPSSEHVTLSGEPVVLHANLNMTVR